MDCKKTYKNSDYVFHKLDTAGSIRVDIDWDNLQLFSLICQSEMCESKTSWVVGNIELN